MENVISWISANWPNILAIYGAVVACASVIIKITPTQADDAILAKVLAVVDFFSTVAVKKPVDPNAPTAVLPK
jgi:hypothetical protein